MRNCNFRGATEEGEINGGSPQFERLQLSFWRLIPHQTCKEHRTEVGKDNDNRYLGISQLYVYVTGPAKIGHVGTNYTLSHNREYLSTGVEYLHSGTFGIKPIDYLMHAETFKAIAWWYKKLWVIETWKSRQILYAHMPYSRRPGHI